MWQAALKKVFLGLVYRAPSRAGPSLTTIAIKNFLNKANSIFPPFCPCPADTVGHSRWHPLAIVRVNTRAAKALDQTRTNRTGATTNNGGTVSRP